MNQTLLQLKQRLAQFGVDAAGVAATCGLAAALLVAWILTAPLFFISDRFTETGRDWRHKKFAKGGL